MTGPHDLRDAQIVTDAKASEGLTESFDRQAGVKQRTEQHVAGRAGKTIDVHHACHQITLSSFMELYSASARIT